MRVRVKICGVTTPDDAAAAAAAGCDAIGLMFFPGSARAVSADAAGEIAAALPPFIAKVGVFVDPDAAEVGAVLQRVRLDVLQFHGDETPAFCAGFGVPWVKAVQMRGGLDFGAWAAPFVGASALLLDGFDASQPELRGGTGAAFDWSAWPHAHARQPLILAGGLTPENVGSAIRAVRPYAVDVSGGVEGADRGVKDRGRLRRFLEAVRAEERRAG